MGITFCSIHIYSTESVAHKDFQFQCLSQGWQTYVPECRDFSDLENTQKTARKISKIVDSPVLWFYELDEEALFLKFYLNGNQVVSYSGSGSGSNKNLQQVPQLVGYQDGHKRRFSKILSCSEIDFQIELLEEFFGVCLLPLPELLAENPQTLSRTRGDTLFKEYSEAEKALTGKRAAIQAELVQELEGVLDNYDLNWFSGKCFKEHYYLYCKARIEGIEKYPACFQNGVIEFISYEEFLKNGADKPYPPRNIGEDPRYKESFYPTKLTFAKNAPAAYAGKEMLLPRGLYGLGFDAKERLILYDDKSTFAVVDKNMKIIAKQRLKGNIRDIDGDYILTYEDIHGFSGVVRVYRICDQ